MTKCAICMKKAPDGELYCRECQRSFDRQVWTKTMLIEWATKRTRRFATAEVRSLRDARDGWARLALTYLKRAVELQKKLDGLAKKPKKTGAK